MGGKTTDQRYRASAARTYEACRRAVSTLGYTVLHSDPVALTITFNTGRSMKSWAGQDLSASVFAEGVEARVVVGGSLAKGGVPLGGGSQIGSWGEKSALSKKFLAAVASALPKVPEPIVAAPAPPASSDLATQLSQLVALHAQGGLTDQEFADAKAALIAGDA